jgi:hypothetical protein
LLIRRLAEADEESLAQAQRRRFEVAGGAEEVPREGVVVGRRGPHVEGDDFFAAGDDDSADGFGELQRLVAAALVLAGVEDLGRRGVVVRLKEPLSFLAPRSALAVVHPVDALRHGFVLTRRGGRLLLS